MRITKYNTILKNDTVGFSISKSEDILKLGFSHSHLQDVQIELARYLLASGVKLIYGGDLSTNGFTELLFQLTQSYKPSELSNDIMLFSYLTFPISLNLSKQKEAELIRRVQFIKFNKPKIFPVEFSKERYFDPKSPEDYYLWSLSLSIMRNEMIEQNDARIFIGGKTRGYKGKYPGIVEEALISLKKKKPIFLIGVFGGATLDLINALSGGVPNRLTKEFQFRGTQLEINNYFNSKIDSKEEKINYESLINLFHRTGIKGLNNGLNERDNKILFKTKDITQMAALMLKGLYTLKLSK